MQNYLYMKDGMTACVITSKLEFRTHLPTNDILKLDRIIGEFQENFAETPYMKQESEQYDNTD
jgi:hypothetical protein